MQVMPFLYATLCRNAKSYDIMLTNEAIALAQ